jgi:hypothetical protein
VNVGTGPEFNAFEDIGFKGVEQFKNSDKVFAA